MHGVVLLDDLFANDGAIRHGFTNLVGYGGRGFAGKLDEREHHEGDVAFKLRAGLLQLYLFVVSIDAVQRFDRSLGM